MESNSSIRRNPEKPNKHVSKNRRSGKLVFFPPNLLTKDFIIWDVIGSFLVVSDWRRRWHPSNVNCTKGLSVGKSNPITWWPTLFHIECGYNWTFLTGCKHNMVEKNHHIKRVCRAKVYFLLTVTPIRSAFHPCKYFLLVEFANPDSITNGKVFDNIFISSSLMFCWKLQTPCLSWPE